MSKDNTNWDVAHKEEYHNEVVASLDKEDVDVAKQHIHEAETYTESQYRRVRRKVDL
jgi:hypothetical protein